MEVLEVENCPTAELSRTNRAILNPGNPFAKQGIEHIAVRSPKARDAFIFSVAVDRSFGDVKKIAFNLTGRKWAQLLKGKPVEAAPYLFDLKRQCLNTITFQVDFLSRDKAPNSEFDHAEMAKQFTTQFANQAFTLNQLFAFVYEHNKSKVTFELTVKDLKAFVIEDGSDVGSLTVEIGLSTPNTVVVFEPMPGSPVKISGGPNNFSAPKIISQDWDFASMGVGGLSEQFNKIFRRAFASRLLPPQFAEKLKAEHVKGILLYGPPGTGKTLIARQIGKMLLSREPKVVNGPEVLNKYVGESEANIRKLFQEAEEEYQKAGVNSGLHVIIFDEIDAICKSRGNSASSAGVSDNIVNQLLSKIDGVNSLPNVLLIGMTNRRDLIDEALLRPGRLELQIEIGVPNRQGRLEILKIHTRQLSENKLLDPSVSLEELADKTKNYTGAEIAGLVRAARDIAVNRVIKADVKIEINQEMLDSIRLTRADFQYAMDHDIKPALGASEDELGAHASTIIPWDPSISTILSNFKSIVSVVSSQGVTSNKPYYLLLVGEPESGLTTLAANLAARSGFPFVRIYKPAATAGKPEFAKISYLDKLFADAARSEQSCVIIDRLEYIINYSDIGPQFSIGIREVLGAHKTDILPQGRSMLVVFTCNNAQAVDVLGISKFSDEIVRVPSLTRPEQIQAVLDHLAESGDSPFSKEQSEELLEVLGSLSFKIGVGRMLRILKSIAHCSTQDRVKTFIQKMHQLNLVTRPRGDFSFEH